VRSGAYARLRRGVITPARVDLGQIDRFERWQEIRHRYLDRVGAVAETRKGPVVIAGYAALAIWNYPFTGTWPHFVELLEPPGSFRRTKRGVVIHRAGFDDDEVIPWGDHFVTSPARTIADLARAGDFAATVVALDHALSMRAGAEQCVSKDAVLELVERRGSSRGAARVKAAVDFADGRSGSGGESLSRVEIFRMGFELPELQVRHPHADGYYDADFKWPAAQNRPPTIGEFDGAMKYSRAQYRDGRDASEVVVAEKSREDYLRALGNGFVRWVWSELRQPTRFLRPKLLAAGIRVVRRPQI
jgi:hypothetical protein